MAEVLATKLKNDTVRMFRDDIANNDYYFCVSSISIDALTRVDAVNSFKSKTEFKENILFGKQCFDSDVKYMIKYHPWQKDQVYEQYDDTVDLENEKFYSVVGPTNNDSGDYRVYKCLSNNNGAQSANPPNYNPVTVNQIYRMPDGYVWKFMYYLTESEFEGYNAVGYIPLMGDFAVDPQLDSDANNVITGSEVSNIFVNNPVDNAGYPFVESGIVAGPPGNDSTVLLRSNFLSEIGNYYSGMTLYVNTPTNVTYTYVIDTYTWDAVADRARVKVIGNPSGDGVIINSTFKILPTVNIIGDGSGATAIPRIVEGNITNIEILTPGQGYNNISASIVDPNYDFDPDDANSIDVRATLRPVLSPIGGHNYNLIDELYCRHVLLYAYITETDNNQIGASNSTSAVGVLKNPTFTPDPVTANTASPDVFDNRIEIITDDYGKLVVNSIVTQEDLDGNELFRARVHAIQASSNTVHLCSYMGPHINQANNDISLDPSLNLINSTGQKISINSPVANNVIESRYTQRSGEVYFMEDFFPIDRQTTSREEYKLVLEF